MMAWRNLSKQARQAGVKSKLPAHNTNHFDFLLSAPGIANITPRYAKVIHLRGLEHGLYTS